VKRVSVIESAGKKDKAMKDCKFMMASAMWLMFLQVAVYAEVVLPPVLSSHMVLQRGMKVPVWGTAAPGEKVTVTFRDQEKSTSADAQGKWKVNLDSLKEGGPDVLHWIDGFAMGSCRSGERGVRR
jgi:hypothetical protein